MFARQYFEKSSGFRPFIAPDPDPSTTLIVVIPCFLEPDVIQTLESLTACTGFEGHTEVIILVNEPENTPGDISRFNQLTVDSIVSWTEVNRTPGITFFPVGPVRLPSRWAGVGLARKAGMDEALWRFNRLGRPGGIIVSLDADTLVDTNYLQAIEAHFRANGVDAGATIRVSHITEGIPPHQAEGIRLYEAYMQYYKDALTWSGFPHALYTIGSAFAVTASAYQRRGGMTRRKAGEDFYFLQTLTQVGHVGEINSTTVHPSARVSERVPFGTGPVMKKWMEGSPDLLYTFNLEAFSDLKTLFAHRKAFYKPTPEVFENLFKQLPEAISAFIQNENLGSRFYELSANCSTEEIFGHRFFQIFNAFKVLRFLHFSHPGYYRKKSLHDCMAELRIKSAPSHPGRYA